MKKEKSLKIVFNKWVCFRKALSNGYQRCIYCGEKIGKGNLACSMVKNVGDDRMYNTWLHIGCIEPFFKNLIKFKEEHAKEIVMEMLKNG